MTQYLWADMRINGEKTNYAAGLATEFAKAPMKSETTGPLFKNY